MIYRKSLADYQFPFPPLQVPKKQIPDGTWIKQQRGAVWYLYICNYHPVQSLESAFNIIVAIRLNISETINAFGEESFPCHSNDR